LRWAAGKAAKTRAADLGDLTLSMLRGEEGNQARELDELVAWLRKTQPAPEIICLSNALLLGFTRRLKAELRAPVVCTLQGEDSFLDALPSKDRDSCVQVLKERAREVEAFIAPSRYFARVMTERLGLRPDRVHVVYNGIDLTGFPNPHSSAGRARQSKPTLGFFARMCKEKGLDTLVDAFILLRQNDRIKDLQLRIGGSCGPVDKIFVDSLRERLRAANLLGEVAFYANIDRTHKLDFLSSLDVFSVPALYGEAFGLYIIEAMAAGVPVVQPETAAFPELLKETGGGLLCKPGDPGKLAHAIEGLLRNPAQAQALGQAGARSVFEKFNAQSMAQACLQIFENIRAHQQVGAREPESAILPK
jgi:glycosyltransferase involved in cell wall biosynthesis